MGIPFIQYNVAPEQFARFGGKDGVPPYFLAGYSLARDDFAVTENSWRKEEEGAIRVDY